MRSAIENLPGSRIREVANAGLGRSDVLAFWFGESDEPTPAFVRDAAAESLRQGETFYSHNLGLLELRGQLQTAGDRVEAAQVDQFMRQNRRRLGRWFRRDE